MNTRCPICGLQMVHHRIGGYRCHNERCNEERRQQEIELVGKALAGELTKEQWQQVINGQEPKEGK